MEEGGATCEKESSSHSGICSGMYIKLALTFFLLICWNTLIFFIKRVWLDFPQGSLAHPRTKYTSFLDDIVAGGRIKMDFYEASVWVIWADLGDVGCLVRRKWDENVLAFWQCVKMKNLLAGKNDIKHVILQLGHAWWWANGNGWSFSLLNDEQMSNKVRVQHQPDRL